MALILIIENDPNLRDDMAQILEIEGYDVLTAEDGASGVQIATERKPQLILSDIFMPNMSGYDVLRKLREDDELAQTPFLFVSAAPDYERIASEFGLTKDSVIVKPFSIPDLVKKVEQLITD